MLNAKPSACYPTYSKAALLGFTNRVVHPEAYILTAITNKDTLLKLKGSKLHSQIIVFPNLSDLVKYPSLDIGICC